MSRKVMSLLVGAFVVMFLLAFQTFENWTLVAHTLEALRNTGPVGTAFASFLLSRVFILILAIMVAGIAVDLWRKEREREKPVEEERPVETAPAKTQPRVENSGNTTAAGSGGNATVNLFVGGEKQEPKIPVASEPKRSHNVSLIRCKSVYVEPGIGHYGYYERDHKTNLQALVACFRNQAEFGRDDIIDANNVTATAHYFDANQQEIYEGVAGICWLNDDHHSVDFKVGGEPNNAILLISNSENSSFFVPFLKRVSTTWNRDALVGDVCVFNKEIAYAALWLMSKNHPLLPLLRFDLKRDADGWKLVTPSL